MVVRVRSPEGADAARIVDRRPLSALEPRADAETAQYVYLGDRNLSPAPVVLVGRYLAKLRGPLAGEALELLRFDVGVSTSDVRDIYRQAPPLVTLAGAPAGPQVVGNLVGQLIVAAFQGTGPSQSVVVTIDIGTPAGTVSITDFGMLYAGRSIDAAVETVLPRALESLANRLEGH